MSMIGGVEYRCNPACFYCVVNKECDLPWEALRRIERRINMHNDAINNYMLGFINGIDEKVQEPGNEEIRAAWMEGDFDSCYEWLKNTYPELTSDQLDWIDDFLSEI